jgi:hypothetical protein
VSLGHGSAHVLEFRDIQDVQLRYDGQPFETPPDITYHELGTAWETRAFGGRVYPVRETENYLREIRGLCIRSSAWNFEMMKANEQWMRQLFTELHWTTAEQPLRPPVDRFAQYAIIRDELLCDHFGERYSRPQKSKEHEKDVYFETGLPRKKYYQPIATIKSRGCKMLTWGPGTCIKPCGIYLV